MYEVYCTTFCCLLGRFGALALLPTAWQASGLGMRNDSDNSNHILSSIYADACPQLTVEYRHINDTSHTHTSACFIDIAPSPLSSSFNPKAARHAHPPSP